MTVSHAGDDPVTTEVSKKIKLAVGLTLAKTNEDKVKAVMDSEFGDKQWSASYSIIEKESGFNPYALNKQSGACGLGQSLPCSKVLNTCGSLTDVVCQSEWIANYIKNRYGTPANAWAFHLIHNWY